MKYLKNYDHQVKSLHVTMILVRKSTRKKKKSLPIELQFIIFNRHKYQTPLI